MDIPPNAGNYTNIVLYKNPYKWIDSLVRNSEDFFERQKLFKCLNSDGTMNMLNIAKTYRHHSETWVLSNRFHTIKYEKLLSDKYDTLMFIAAALDTDMINDDIIEPRQSIPLETNAKKTYTHVSCTHLVRRMKALNSSSIHRSGENNTLQEQQEEKLVDQNPMEGIKCLQKYMKMEKKKRRRR